MVVTSQVNIATLMSNSHHNDRSELRKFIRHQRNHLSQATQTQEAMRLLNVLSAHPNIIKASNIALYLSNDGELNTEPFIHWCWQKKINTYLPVIHPFSKSQLLFLHYHQHSKMKANCYGILEPKLNVNDIIPTHALDIIFTPLVAFDEAGNRMGMGGGFYDRTLAHWYRDYQTNKKTTPRPIGLAHDCQKVSSLTAQAWDIPLPEIITPTQHYRFSSHL